STSLNSLASLIHAAKSRASVIIITHRNFSYERIYQDFKILVYQTLRRTFQNKAVYVVKGLKNKKMVSFGRPLNVPLLVLLLWELLQVSPIQSTFRRLSFGGSRSLHW